LEQQFAQQLQGQQEDGNGSLAHLAPFDSRLVEITIPSHSFLIGKTMEQSRLREKYDLNVVFIKRRDNSVVTAKAQELIFPEDNLLCFGTDRAIEHLQQDIEKSQNAVPPMHEMTNFAMRRIPIDAASPWLGAAIRQLKLTEKHQCLVVGVERDKDRIQNPKSDLVLKLGDVLWVVGERKFLAELT
jgi:CPA2 family monovalent cation:H+ antiporter-2